ncbi:MAG: MBOAT family protein [Leptospiraceae bacterium]|nr:MBOAT family protein [Leptospiraceae bacterium]MCK6380767.1 MBOAT family protein [Leptospiraceae bacterium]NUM41137.1 MBOAT family protein [Leptospiraceae bacterium]
MLFTSITFLIFFSIVYLIYWSIPSDKGKKWILLLSSFVFYGTWSVSFLFHFLFFVLINYIFSVYLLQHKSKSILRLAVIINLLNLGVFKYFYFFTDTLYHISGSSFFTELSKGSFKILLPLAISFYTFQMLAYVIDSYRGDIKEKESLLDFTIFIMFFPQLIAGPIMRSGDFIPELKKIKPNKEFIYPGMSFIILGVFKKVLIADSIAGIIDPIWNNPSEYSAISLILSIYGFSWQVYCDFSGYTDIARGVAYLLGFQIPENFKAPYLAESPKDLWRRWHITLATWLRDYLYIPLGGSRTSELRSYFNLIVTFTLGGFWHGANWTYILWGFFHGVMLALERLTERFQLTLTLQNKAGKYFRIVFTYHIFLVGVLFFRSNNMTSLWVMVKKILTISPGVNATGSETLVYLFILGFLSQLPQYFDKLPSGIVKYQKPLILFSSIVLLVSIGLYSRSGKEFVYFQF